MKFRKYVTVSFYSVAFFAAIAFFAFSPAAENITGIGIRMYAAQVVPDTATTSTLANSDLVFAIAAGQSIHIRYSVPFSLSATNLGVKFQVTVPAGGVAFNSSSVVYSDADSIVAVSNIVSSAAQGTALGTVGNHLAIVDATITNGATAGNVTLQFAQNATNAGNAILLRGAFAEAVKF